MGIESLKNAGEQYEALKEIHSNLLKDLQSAGLKEQQIARAYDKASEALNQSPGSFESIYTFLNSFGYTKPFVRDIKDIFKTNRLQFIALQSYLQRISLNPQVYMLKHLSGDAPGHYEYRVGRSFRLYFRYTEERKIILERFGDKSIQPRILSYLSGSQDVDISLAKTPANI